MKVSQIKAKVAKKIAKGKAKVAKKCGRRGKTVAALLVAFGVTAVVSGCLYPTAPSRSQHLAFEHCTFTIIGGGDGGSNPGCTNDVARIDIGSQAMQIETSGTENNTNTPTQTVDTKPEIAVGVGGSSAGVGQGGAAKQGVGAAIGSAVDAVSGMSSGGKDDDAEAEVTPAPTTDKSASECEGGACVDCLPK